MKTIMNTMIKRTMKHINKQGKQYGDINNQQQGLFKRKRKTNAEIADNLSHYMFTGNHIMNLLIDTSHQSKNQKKKENQNEYNTHISKHKSSNNELFIPKEYDTLFWCYYIIVNSVAKYEQLFGKTYKEEQAQKISIVESLNAYKSLFKQYKWKKNIIERELIYEKSISINTLMCICAIAKINVIVVNNNCIYTLMETWDKNNDDIVDNDMIDNNNRNKIHIIQKCEDNVYGYLQMSQTELKKYYDSLCKDHWEITNFNKPLAPISKYKINMLKDICTKLKIPTTTPDGKRIKKQELYNLIKSEIKV